MPVFTIPLDDAAELGAFTKLVDLDGTTYQLGFQLNSREGNWYWELRDSEGNPLRSGIKVVSNYPMIRLYMAQGRPPGEIMSLDTRPEPADPGLEDLNDTSVFSYADQAEIQGL